MSHEYSTGSTEDGELIGGEISPEITDRHISLAVSQNKADLLAEDIECLHMCLDDLGIPRNDGNGNVYSMWGRVQKAIKKEREACAKVCEDQANEPECPERAVYCAEDRKSVV